MVASTLGRHSLEKVIWSVRSGKATRPIGCVVPLITTKPSCLSLPPDLYFHSWKSWKIASGIFKVEMLHKDWDQNELTCDKWEGGNFCFVLPQVPKSCCIFSPKHQPEENIIKTITRLFRTIPSLIVLGKGRFWIIYVFMDIVCYSLPLPPSLPLLP